MLYLMFKEKVKLVKQIEEENTEDEEKNKPSE